MNNDVAQQILNKMDSMQQDIYNKMDSKLDAMQQDFYNKMDSKLDTMQQDIYNKMDNMQQDIYNKMDSKLDAMQQAIDTKMDNMQQDIYNKMDNMQQDIRTLQKDVAIIQHEHGSKIQLLLDYAVQNSEEHAKMNALLEKHSSILDNHEIRLQIAEDKLASSL